MTRSFLARLLLYASTVFLLVSCQKDLSTKNNLPPDLAAPSKMNSGFHLEKTNTFYGPQEQLGDGKVHTFFTVTHTNVPTEIGIEMTAGALQGLPDENVQLSFPFHKKASESTPFVHVLMDWNVHGHEPVFYELPHFDFHFYMISEAERMAISATSPLMDQLPQQQYWPQGSLVRTKVASIYLTGTCKPWVLLHTVAKKGAAKSIKLLKNDLPNSVSFQTIAFFSLL